MRDNGSECPINAPWPLEREGMRVFLYDREFKEYSLERNDAKLKGVLTAHFEPGMNSIMKNKIIDGHIYVSFEHVKGRMFERRTRTCFSMKELKGKIPPDEYLRLWSDCYAEASRQVRCTLFCHNRSDM